MSHEEEISTFTAITGADAATAEQYLSSCGWDVETAFNIFSAAGAGDESGGGAGGVAAAASANPGDGAALHDLRGLPDTDADAAMAAALADEEIRAESTADGGYLNGGGGGGGGGSAGTSRATGGRAATRHTERYDADGVRLQDEYTTSRLVDFDNDGTGAAGPLAMLGLLRGLSGHPRGAADGNDALLAAMAEHGLGVGTANAGTLAFSGALPRGHGGGLGQAAAAPAVVDLPDSEWMFPLPEGAKRINCGGEISFARQRAREERKWVLVNLQSVDIFDSHRMNRDTWKDDTVLSVVEASFVLWQRSSSSDQGRHFMRLYGLSAQAEASEGQATELPMVAILGPTGSVAWQRSGFVPPAELGVDLMDFLDTHCLDDTHETKGRGKAQRGGGGRRTADSDSDEDSDGKAKGSAEESIAASLAAVGAPSPRTAAALAAAANGEDGSGEGGRAAAASSAPGGGGEEEEDWAGIGAGGRAAGGSGGGAEDEDAALAEAIRLSMLDGEEGGGDGGGGGGQGAGNMAEPGGGGSAEVDALVEMLRDQAALSSPHTPAAAADDASSGDPAAAAATEGAAKAVVPAGSHLPLGWEASLKPEPAKGAAGSTRVQLRLATGKVVVRRFPRAEPGTVKALFALAVHHVPEARERAFSLQTPIASGNLLEGARSGASLEEQELTNSKVLMTWDE